MVSFGKALSLPFADFRKLFIGALLYMVPILNIITGMFALGYVLDIARSTMEGRFELPEWSGWGTLFVEGLLAAIISLIWFIPVMIVGGILLGGAFLSLITGDFTAIAAVVGSASIVGVLAIITSYFAPGALLSFARARTFGAGFNFGDIFRKTLTGKYFTAWILALLATLVLNILLGVIGALLGYLGTIGTILVFVVAGFVSFIGVVIAFSLYGEAYGVEAYPSNSYAKVNHRRRR